MRSAFAVAGWALALAGACSSTTDNNKCVPGESAACACTDGRAGAQLCLAGGTYDVCVCTAPADAGAPDAREEDAGEPDADPTDTGRLDASAPPDAGAPDARLPVFCDEPPPGFVRIPAGTGLMGTAEDLSASDDERPQHPIRITRDLWMQATEVTQAEWSRYRPTNPSLHANCPSCPVERVSWHDAVDFANAWSALCGLPACYPDTREARVGAQLDLTCTGFRLPTEAEWEYAARAGTTSSFYTGYPLHPEIDHPDCEPRLDPIAWYRCTAGQTQPVGLLAPNAWGLFDMAGNVEEMTSDGKRTYPADAVMAVDPLGPPLDALDGHRAVRGGSYDSPSWGCRSAQRIEDGAALGSGLTGFRLVRLAR